MIKEQYLQFEAAYPKAATALQVLLGSFLMAVLAQITVPLKPVPMSLQTLGVFLLPMLQNKKTAAYSLVLYLAEATMGLPVLSSMKVNPLWIAGPTAGYLLSFPVAAYIIGSLLENAPKRSLLWSTVALLAGQAVIYSFGLTVLSFFIGWKQAVLAGLLPFVPVNFYKLAVALGISRALKRFYD